jgi:hypothetical protein
VEGNMAQNITSVSELTQVSATDFLAQAQSGDLLFCAGKDVIDDAIDAVTSSIWSHVAIIWYLEDVQEWVVLEATATHGVSFSTLQSYLDDYDGGIALAHRPVLTEDDKILALKTGIQVLDEPYGYLQIGEFLLKKFFSMVKVSDSDKAMVCSALVQYEYSKTEHPLQVDGTPTPQQVWTEATVEPKYALSK